MDVVAREHGAPTIESLLASKEIVIFCGSGGVGKTTTAAAAAVMAALRHGGKVLVLTVDPARRLASALGLPGLGNRAVQIPVSAFETAGVTPRGEMWAAMLDTKQSWDDLVHRHAPDRGTERRILENPLYQNIAGKFVQSHDYIAMERLYELHASGDYDLIVVDTPPTRNALDFIEAPDRMAEFFSSRLLRMLIVPYRSRVVNLASRPFYQIADRILGSQFLADIAEFFILFQTMYDGFVQRARAVERLLHAPRTSFVVVATLEAAPVREAEFFVRVLHDRHYPLGALVLNKTLPAYLLDEDAGRRAERLCASAADLAGRARARADGDRATEAGAGRARARADHADRAGSDRADLATQVGADPAVLARVLAEVGDNFRNLLVVAQRESTQRAGLSALPEVVATVPELDEDIYDLAGLLRLGERVWS